MPDVASGSAASQTFAAQTVAQGAMKHYGLFRVKPGSLLEVRLSGAGATLGNPDLYADFTANPNSTAGSAAPTSAAPRRSANCRCRAIAAMCLWRCGGIRRRTTRCR